MKKIVLTKIAGIPVYWDGTDITYTAGLMVDADGSPRCYAPPPLKGLDALGNAGRPGNWWALVTDTGKPDGEPVTQRPTDPAPGFYVSTTAYQREGFHRKNPARYLDAETVPFAVIPPQLRTLVSPVVLGCRVVMRHLLKNRQVSGVVGDIGPKTKLGEASMAAAMALGIPSSPRIGGTEQKVVLYTITPGVAADGFVLKPA